MAAFCHAWSYRRREADGTIRTLSQCGCEDLEDMVPRQMDVRVDTLSSVVTMGIDNETIVGVYIAAANQHLPEPIE